MSISLRSLFSVAAILIAACRDHDSAGQEFPPELAASLQASLDQSIAGGLAPGVSLYVWHPDHGSWAGSSGSGDLDQGTPLIPAAHFRAGSMLKPLVATAILQRVEDGQLALDAKLTDLLPATITDSIDNATVIDVRMLLDHTSGIPEFLTPDIHAAAGADPAHVWTLAEFLASVEAQAAGTPGAGYGYSNTNYVLLGEILSALTGRDWRDVVTEDVIDRAGMTESSLPPPGDRAVPEPVARGYIVLGDQGLVDFSGMDPSMAAASGGHALVTTTADMTTFLRALFAGELFDHPETLAQMLAYRPAVEAEAYQTEYGLGISVTEVEGRRFVGHLGRTAGYWGFTFHEPATGYTFSGFMNTEGDLGAFVGPIMALLGG